MPEGRAPEFAQGSNRPGIGGGPDGQGFDELAEWYHTKAGAAYIAQQGDICHFVRIHGKVYPLDRYMKKRIRERVGLPEQDERRTARALERQLQGAPEWEAKAAASSRMARTLGRRRVGSLG